MVIFLKTYTKRELLIFFLYILLFISFLFYSFTQIDLGLAISRNESLQQIVRSFQEIGYFQRPTSTMYYILLLAVFYILYGVSLYFVHKKKLHKKVIWHCIIAAAVILTFSYTAFSHDIFNYMFDARIVTHYQENPYLHKALDYPNDPMLGFMHWTHRTFPYGPLWLALTLPFSFLGFGYFLPTFFLFKILTTLSYIVSVYSIGKILQKIASQKEILGLAFFGLNPLIIIESLINSHIDIVMMAFSLFAFYLLLQKKVISSTLLFIISIGIKFVTGFLFPVFLYAVYKQKKNQTINWKEITYFFLLTIIVGVVVETSQGMFQPWYLIPIIAYASLVAEAYFISVSLFIITFFVSLTYVPFLFTGNWDPPILSVLNDLYLFGYSLAFFTVAMIFFYNQIALAKKIKEEKKKKEHEKKYK